MRVGRSPTRTLSDLVADSDLDMLSTYQVKNLAQPASGEALRKGSAEILNADIHADAAVAITKLDTTVLSDAAIAALITTHAEGASHRWTDEKLRKGAGSEAAPDEIAIPSVVYGELGIEAMELIPATGNMVDCQYINDGETAAFAYTAALTKYCEIMLPAPAHITQFRHYGSSQNTGNGVFKIQYKSLAGAWTDYVTGVALDTVGEWSAWNSTGGDVVAVAIRLVITTLDDSAYTRVGQLEVKF